jgi:crotonobetainyl-CoA:carnitine CoA-transferase CaiB-like acyl-CoA transferase
MSLPLEGLRVIDFSRVLAGPHCAKLLLELGADVVKIEPPAGDLSRLAFPNSGGISGYYAQQNAGKRNVSIDLNVPEAVGVVTNLCARADVIIENFRPGALDSFGLGYDDVCAVNPAVVYASISGYGQHGSWKNRMAYAPTVQAEVGFTQNTHNQFGADGLHRKTDALSHADVYAGMHATIAILAALRHRLETGRGQYIDIAMASVMTMMNERVHYDLSGLDLGDERPVLGATDAPFFTSPEGIEFVAPFSLVGTASFGFWTNAMRRPDIKDDPRFATPTLRLQHFNALHGIIQNWINTFENMASLDAQLDEAKIATGRVRTITDFADTDWAKAWRVTQQVSDRHGGQITIPAAPWHFSEHDGALVEQQPAFQGEHNREILLELGYDEGDIETLVKLSALIEPARAAG